MADNVTSAPIPATLLVALRIGIRSSTTLTSDDAD
jgi:hypothetical protein